MTVQQNYIKLSFLFNELATETRLIWPYEVVWQHMTFNITKTRAVLKGARSGNVPCVPAVATRSAPFWLWQKNSFIHLPCIDGCPFCPCPCPPPPLRHANKSGSDHELRSTLFTVPNRATMAARKLFTFSKVYVNEREESMWAYKRLKSLYQVSETLGQQKWQ